MACCMHQSGAHCFIMFAKSLNTLIRAVTISVVRVVLLLINICRLGSLWHCLRSVIVISWNNRTWRDGPISRVIQVSAIIIVVAIVVIWVLRLIGILRCWWWWNWWLIGRVNSRRDWPMLNVVGFVVPIVLVVRILIEGFVVWVKARSLCCRSWTIIWVIPN